MDLDWEQLWAPYDQPTYADVLSKIGPEDAVLEIGAGDLRLARRLAQRAQRVWAIERQAELLERGLVERPLPENLVVLQGDACTLPFPAGVTAGVLLMRHCTHFRLYAEKLRAAGCRRLITNARWRCGTELVSLDAPRLPYGAAPAGWYACWCGAAGFKPGLAEDFTPEDEAIITEVIECPHCRSLYG